MSQKGGDANRQKELNTQQSHTDSRLNKSESIMLRPSSLLSGGSSSSAGAASSSTSSAPKSFLRPASFQVGSSTDGSAGESSACDAFPSDSSTSSPAAATSSSSSIADNPFLALANNPTAMDDDNDENEAKPTAASSSTITENGGSSPSTSAGAKSLNGLAKTANLFKTANPTIPTTSSTSTSGFVFGQNVHERVTGESIHECTSTSASSSASSSLFAIAGSSSTPDSVTTPSVEASVESLTEVARAYEESRAQKRKYEEVETFTGEEDETNVLDVNSKLFAFVASNWEERGPGNLRVNDNKDRKKSPRVVFRTSGNLRVLLNTKIWPGMIVERPSQKSLRFSAIDSDGQIKIFLVMARPDDISNLFTQLTKRINYEKSRPVPIVDVTSDTVTESVSETSPSSSSVLAPSIYVTPAADDDSAEADAENENEDDVVVSSAQKKIALDSSVSTTNDTKPDDGGVDTTTENVN